MKLNNLNMKNIASTNYGNDLRSPTCMNNEPLLDERDLATEPAPATEDVLAWLDAAITASQPTPEEPGDRAEPEAEAAPDAAAPEPPSAPSSEALDPAVRNRLIAEAFMKGGEQAVMELMEQLSGADPTLK